jgi:NAD(P)-dependent dehydrogenase (short-subunit alcohol dehydrogenase family)
MGRLEGKVALVVGGGADGPPGADEDLPIGNGRATAIECARAGAAVMVADRSPEAARATADRIRSEGGTASAVACDVSDEQQCRAAVETTVRELGGLQLLVTNVGISDMGPVAQVPTEDFDRVMAVNVRGHFLAIKHALPELEKSGGAIVAVSSIYALRTGAAGVGYDTSKAALLGLSRNVATRAAPHGVRMNAVLPGIIDSTMLRRYSAGQEVDFSRKVPLGRVGTPWDVAKAIVFLLSEDAAFITGTELIVDGGMSACDEAGSPLEADQRP